MRTPDFLPVLSAGAHRDPKQGACVMEYVSLLAGETWSDRPDCTHPVLASMARVVNDYLPDDRRQELVPLIGRLFGTANHDRELSLRLTLWCAEQVVHLAGREARAAVETVRGYLAGEASVAECKIAATVCHISHAYYAAHAYFATNAAYYAAKAVYSDTHFDANGAANAAKAAHADVDLVALLTGLIDEYDRLTGRTETADVDLAVLAEAVR